MEAFSVKINSAALLASNTVFFPHTLNSTALAAFLNERPKESSVCKVFKMQLLIQIWLFTISLVKAQKSINYLLLLEDGGVQVHLKALFRIKSKF